jgi:hypothetical protein
MFLKKYLNRIVLSLYRWYIPEVCILIICAYLYFFNSFRYSFPVGYSGLYALMAEELKSNSFRLPWTIPFYGPGGIPYAYPPLGFYLEAISTNIFHVSTFTYLRFIPPSLTIVFIVLDYILIRKIASSRLIAIIGISLTASAGPIYEYHVEAAGMVRALALIFAITSLIFTWDALVNQDSRRSSFLRSLLAGIALGLTVLSHLSYALFSILGILIFTLFINTKKLLERFILLMVIFGSGLFLSSLWWLRLLSRYGILFLTNPARSHGNFGVLIGSFLSGIRMPIVFIQHLIGTLNNWDPPILIGLIVTGLVTLFVRRKWMLIAWFLLVFIIIGEADRFLIIIGCIATADALGALLLFFRHSDESHLQTDFISYATGIAILLLLSFYGGFRIIRSIKPSLSNSVIEVTTWIHNNTKPDDQYLLLEDNNDLDEWIPYLTHRTPLTGSWGNEWVGNLASLADLSSKVNQCIGDQSNTCLQKVINQRQLKVSFMISLNSNSLLNKQIEADMSWKSVFKNDQFVVFARK